MDALTCHLYVFLSIWSDEIALYPPLPFPTPWIVCVFAFRPQREKEKFMFCLNKKRITTPVARTGLGSLPPPFFVAYKNRQSVDQMRRHTFKKEKKQTQEHAGVIVCSIEMTEPAAAYMELVYIILFSLHFGVLCISICSHQKTDDFEMGRER